MRELVRSSRLITLTGAGGSGKTRLALLLVELAPLTNGGQIDGAVAAAYSDAYSSGAQLSSEQALDLALAGDSAD